LTKIHDKLIEGTDRNEKSPTPKESAPKFR